MEMSPNLKPISDSVLIADLKCLVAKERELLTEILNYLAEVDKRRLYLARGYPSLFAFLTGELGYSESATQRRIEAMRLMRDVPELEEIIERGDISLTVASQLGTFFRQESQKRREFKAQAITREEKLSLLENLKGASSRECEKKLAAIAPESMLPKEKIRPISEDKTLIQFTAGKGLMNKIQKLKGLLSHRNETGMLEELIERLADIALEKLDPERREQRRLKRRSKKSDPQTISPPAPEVSKGARPIAPARTKSIAKKPTRHIPQPLSDQIRIRDQGRCQHRDPKTGNICGSTQRVEIDHKFPFSLGGENSADNLQLRCQAHNQWRAGMLFGKTFGS